MSNQIAVMADRLNIDPDDLNSIVKSTIMPSKVPVSNEQFVSFMAVANEYKLNPLVKEIYAFPAKGGGIQPVVSIDGWLKIANNHPDFNGMEFDDEIVDGKLVSITCHIFRKSMDRPISATEYFDECVRPTDVWKKWPRRMLRHKATIQTIRYAFGISGIIDPDEAERFKETKLGTVERDISPKTNIIEQAAIKEEKAPKLTRQETFHQWCTAVEDASDPGELQAAFGQGWNALKKMKAGKESKTLQEIYEERKVYFEKLKSE